MSITLGAATKLLDDMMINYSEWHTERTPQGKKVNSVEETSSLGDKIDAIMSMLANGRSHIDPNNVPLASLVAQEENVDVNFIKSNNFNNNAYRNNYGNNNYRPYPSNNGNGYGNSYGNSYNNNKSVPSGLEVMLKEFISTQTAFNKTVEEKLGKIDVLASKVDSLALDVDLLKLKVMPEEVKDARFAKTNAIQVRINDNIRMLAELHARWDREEKEKLAKENNVAKVWTITTTSNVDSTHVATPPTINGSTLAPVSLVLRRTTLLHQQPSRASWLLRFDNLGFFRGKTCCAHHTFLLGFPTDVYIYAHHPDHVCLLSRSLYGLKQAPRAWYQRIAAFLHQLGFRSTRSDASLFVYNNGATTAYLLLYVDDIILTASSTDLLRQITERLRAEFALKDLGPLHYFLGIEVVRRTDGFFLHQRKYAHELLDRAGMLNCKPVATPVDTKSKLSATDGSLATDASFYRSIVGALQYLTLTRPELQYAVQQVCLHMHAPRDPHWAAVKRILRYIRGTMDFGLSLHASTATDIVAYSDADWAGCPDTRRSTSGYCVYFGPSLISWSSKRQPTVSRSSAEAEYRAVANAVAEVSWLRQLLVELSCPVAKATVVYCDNVSAVYLSANPVHHRRTKHIELDIHFVREQGFQEKLAFIEELRGLRPFVLDSWLILGDFNLIAKASDKNNLNINHSLIGKFRAARDFLELKDMRMEGRRFTWSNAQADLVLTKIDHVFFSAEWDVAFPKAYLQAITSACSDHAPLFLQGTVANARKPSFKFEEFWLSMHGFKETVSAAWGKVVLAPDPIRRVHIKLSRTTKALKKWQRECVGNLRTQISTAKEIIWRID
ncbi:hypothetical protein QYE76_009350 [Lolium multiflorum]|uniref:Reverse transcriptase Ty1/copia-type domain-containing protein n=1 Tax=Lolium multiflorum TaxID=4521 RepID=A0AAD8TV32_LOLMU|nr:hypothetical protein QYE76_009350 [Lolium multiflorum]